MKDRFFKGGHPLKPRDRRHYPNVLLIQNQGGVKNATVIPNHGAVTMNFWSCRLINDIIKWSRPEAGITPPMGSNLAIAG